MIRERERLGLWLADNRIVWLRPVVVSAILAGSALWAPRASLTQVGLAAGFGILVAMLRWPLIAVMCIVPAAQMVPFALGTGTETSIHAGMLLPAVAAAAWLLGMLSRHELRLLPSRPILPLLVLCVIACLSFVVGLQPWLPRAETASLAAQVGGLSIFLFSALAFLLVAHLLPDLRWLEHMVAIFLAIGAVYMLRDVAPPLLRSLSFTAPSADGSMFWLWIVALALSQGLVNRRLPRLVRLGLLGLTGLTLGVGLIQLKDWNSGWVPGLVATGVILWLAAPRIALPLTLLGGVAVLMNLPTLLDTYVLNDYKQYDLLTRTAAWEIVWKIIWSAPILGTGFANYYWYTPLFPILGYAVNFSSHNNYIDLLAQTGILGFAAFGWFMAEIGVLAWRLRRVAADGFARAYVYGALGGLSGTLVAAFLGDWVLPFVYNIGLKGFRASVLAWLFLGGLLVVERASRAGSDPARESTAGGRGGAPARAFSTGAPRTSYARLPMPQANIGQVLP